MLEQRQKARRVELEKGIEVVRLARHVSISVGLAKLAPKPKLTLRLGQRAALAALLLGLPAPHPAVPVGADEDVGRRAPREAGDAVVPGGLDVVVCRSRHGVGAGCRGGGSEGGHDAMVLGPLCWGWRVWVLFG